MLANMLVCLVRYARLVKLVYCATAMRMVKTSWTPELEDRPWHEIVPKLKWKWANINVKLYYLSIYRCSGSLTLEIQPFHNRATMYSQDLSPEDDGKPSPLMNGI